MGGENHSIDVDRILVTVGRKANLSGWGLEETGVRLIQMVVQYVPTENAEQTFQEFMLSAMWQESQCLPTKQVQRGNGCRDHLRVRKRI